MPDKVSNSLMDRIHAAEGRYHEAERTYRSAPSQMPKEKRVELLYAWNDTAREYFSLLVGAIVTEKPRTTYTQNPALAADFLKTVVNHYAGVKHEVETKKLGIAYERLKPSLMKFTDIQRLVKENDPMVARDLRNPFVQAGLAIYGFEDDPQSPTQAADKGRWFIFGCALFAVAVAFAAWGFYLGRLSEEQRTILVWILSLASGFAAGAFAGSITAKARRWRPGIAIIATGGFAVWLLSSYILFPRSVIRSDGTASASSYYLQLNGQASVPGKSYTVDLGYVVAGKTLDFTLAVRLESGTERFVLGEMLPPLMIAGSSGSGEVNLTSQQPVSFELRLETPPVGGLQIREIQFLVPADNSPAIGRGLVLKVQWTALDELVRVVKHSGLRPSGEGQDFSPPYEVWSEAPNPGDYVLDSGTYSLTGDRACGSYSTCTPHSEEKKYGLTFTLQGHEECKGPFSDCASVRSSEGHVDAVFRLRPSIPNLTGS